MSSRLVPPGANEGTVRTSAGVLRMLSAGQRTEAPDLLFVHGGGTDSAGISWYRLMAPLSSDRRAWAIDLPGFGGSIEVPPVGGPGELSDVVAEAIRNVSARPVVIVGVSMGGDIALNVALRHPEIVAGLVLVAPGGLVPAIGGRATQFGAWLAARLPDWALTPLARIANRFTAAALRAIVVDPTTIPDAVTSEFVREARHPRGGLAYGRYNQATLGPRGMRNDLSGVVAAITAPTLLFHGREDRMVSIEGSRRAAERMPRAHLVEQPECGHWAQLEAHETFLAEVRIFLSSLDADDA